MVNIPAGSFTMGRTKLTSDDKTNMRPHVLLDDRPLHKVTISAFQLDKHEVTNAEYQVFVRKTGHKPPYHWIGDQPADLPVYNVSWDDADAYCRWAGGRLPTEAEWEYAARGGNVDVDYPWGDQPDAKLARFNVPTGAGPVAKFPPNGFGLFDMAGNVSEWTADWFDGSYYASSPAVDPKGPDTGEYKVIRGGAWSDSSHRITVFFRNWVRPNQRTPNIGFRCAR
jgi:iron(II)-dependent oxidoreductase